MCIVGRHLYSKIPQFDTSRAKVLGLTFVDINETVDDMIKKMIELGIVKAK